MIKSPIDLDIYINTPEVTQRIKLGMEFDYSECILRNTTFYRIDAIYQYIENGIDQGTIMFIGGDQVVTPMKYEKVKALINKHI